MCFFAVFMCVYKTFNSNLLFFVVATGEFKLAKYFTDEEFFCAHSIEEMHSCGL